MKYNLQVCYRLSLLQLISIQKNFRLLKIRRLIILREYFQSLDPQKRLLKPLISDQVRIKLSKFLKIIREKESICRGEVKQEVKMVEVVFKIVCHHPNHSKFYHFWEKF